MLSAKHTTSEQGERAVKSCLVQTETRHAFGKASLPLCLGAFLAHPLAHGGNREPVLGRIITGRGVVVLGSGMQVAGRGNMENLLDDVGNFPEHWTQGNGRHRLGLLTETGADSQFPAETATQ